MSSFPINNKSEIVALRDTFTEFNSKFPKQFTPEIITAFQVGFRSGQSSTMSIDSVNPHVFQLVMSYINAIGNVYDFNQIYSSTYHNLLFNPNDRFSLFSYLFLPLACNLQGSTLANTSNKLAELLKSSADYKQRKIKDTEIKQTIVKTGKVTIAHGENGKLIRAGKHKINMKDIVITPECIDLLDDLVNLCMDIFKTGKIGKGEPTLYLCCMYHLIFRQSMSALHENNEQNCDIPYLYDRGVLSTFIDTLIRYESSITNSNSGVKINNVAVVKGTNLTKLLPDSYKTAVVVCINNNTVIGHKLNALLARILASGISKQLKSIDEIFGILSNNASTNTPLAAGSQFYGNAFNNLMANKYVLWQCNQIGNVVATYFNKEGTRDRTELKALVAQNPNVPISQLEKQIVRKYYRPELLTSEIADPFQFTKLFGLFTVTALTKIGIIDHTDPKTYTEDDNEQDQIEMEME